MTERLAEITARIDGIRQLGAVVNAMRGIAAARAQQARKQLGPVDTYAASIAAAIGAVLPLMPAHSVAKAHTQAKPAMDPKTGLFEQFEGYFKLEDIDLSHYAGRSVPMDVVLGRQRIARSQVVKQADVVALLGLLPEEFSGDSGLKNFQHYEPRCSHGSSLSRAMHGLVAARLGLTAMARNFLRDVAAIDLCETHVASDGGIHIAALGGNWLTAVFGFAGLSVTAEGLALNPQLPPDWTNLAFTVQWQGRTVNIRIVQAGAVIEATLQSGPPMTLMVRGQAQRLSWIA